MYIRAGCWKGTTPTYSSYIALKKTYCCGIRRLNGGSNMEGLKLSKIQTLVICEGSAENGNYRYFVGIMNYLYFKEKI